MSELIDNEGRRRKELLKHLILQLHQGAAPEQVRKQLTRMLGQVPYGMVVEVEQELMAEGLPAEEVTKLCHLHGAALEGTIDLARAPAAPPGHPVHTFQRENAALREELAGLDRAVEDLSALEAGEPPGEALLAVRARLNALTDVEKHYLRKEHLLFPYLERHGITGPPKVMWTKHDETRALLRAAIEALRAAPASAAAAREAVARVVKPAAQAIADMVGREQDILLPMSLDTLTELEWWEVARQSEEIGYCLVEPGEGWRPASVPADAPASAGASGRIQLPTGSFTAPELEAFLNALPLDATFVDAEDRVRYFTHGGERVFARSRAVLGRKVQFCHPPSSVDTVDRILAGFRSGKQDRAAFWIDLRGKFVHIEYVAMRDGAGKYLGCLEVTQDLTAKRALTGEQRLLSWQEEPAAAACPAAAPAQPHAHAHAHGPQAHAMPPPAAAPVAPESRPAWAAPAAIARSYDARADILAGQHPLQRVMGDLAQLGPGKVYELVTPFVPGPLVEIARTQGFEVASATEGAGLVRSWFRR